MTWRFDWITSWDEIWADDFVAQWHEWMAESPTAHVFFHPTLARVWVDTYMPLRRIEPRFLVATEGDCTVFLPMVLWRKNWNNAFQRVIVPVGYSDYDYHDPIVVASKGRFDWGDFWDALCRELVTSTRHKEYDLVNVPGIKREHTDCERRWSRNELCPFIDLSAYVCLDDFVASLNKKLRYNLRRYRKHLDSCGTVSFEVFSPSDSEGIRKALGRMLFHHSSRWPRAYKAPSFHDKLLRYGMKDGLVHFSKLCLDGTPISWRVGFVFRDRFYSYMPAYDVQYESFSPGRLHLLFCVGDAIRLNLRVYDQLRGTESYKAGWTNQVERLYRLRFENSALSSRLRNVAADHIKPMLINAFAR